MRGLTLALALATAGGAVAQVAPQDFESVYQKRFADLMRDHGVVTRYEPLEVVPGAEALRPLPVAGRRAVADAALQAGADYAAANRSSAFIVWRDGRVQTERYFGDTTAETELASKSLSKPLTALAIGRAIQLGRIKSLDQPVADFIPEWRGTPKAEILVRHLLDMRSGFLEQAFSTDPDSPLNRAYISPDHGAYLVNHYPLTHRPGQHYGYSNATSELVAVLIERATGRRYAEFVGHEVLAPIGAPGGRIWIDWPAGLAHSGCCIMLPARSWLAMAVLVLNDGMANGRRLLPRGYVAEMMRGTPQNPRYGLGLWIAGDYVERRGFSDPDLPGPKVLHGAPYLDRDLVLFDGNGDQTVYISRAARMVILRTGDSPPREPEWDNAYLPNLLMAGLIPSRHDRLLTPQPRPNPEAGAKP